MNIILAPHVDDEVIGCFSLLERGSIDKVIYFFDCTDDRVAEAMKSSENFGVDILFCSLDSLPMYIELDDVLYVPNIKDAHPHHKAVNLFAKTLPNKKYYYSVDMNTTFDVLCSSFQYQKKAALYELFPSQKVLFDRDDKYHLFESIRESDSFKKVWVTFQRKGMHCYPNAPDDVAYLQDQHRHLFKFKVTIEVFHDDREIEFHQFLNWCEDLYDSKLLELDYKSCEMMADDLYSKILLQFPNRYVKIEVSEDGECGAEVEYTC